MDATERKRRELLADRRVNLAALRTEYDALEKELAERRDQADSEAFDVLRAVRDWFYEVHYHGRPMRDPRRILRRIEEVL